MLFTWGKPKHRSTNSYEPKTPKLSSVSLPDERYTPIIYQPVYSERAPTRNSFFKRCSTDFRTSTPRRNTIQPEIIVGRPKSRSRTVSTPAREVEAPRPIRPHPSQGPFVPITEQVDRIRIDSSRGAFAPIAVPSAAYLEDKVRRERREAGTDSAPTKYMTQQEYLDMMRKRAEKIGSSYSLGPSKAWIEDQEELAKRHAPSAPPMNKNAKVLIEEENEDIKKLVPIPVVDSLPVTVKAPSTKPLKSALKKAPSIKQQTLEPLYKAREYRDSRAYYSENETDRIKPAVNVTKTPSKAFLEEQQEKIEESKKRQHKLQHQHSNSHPVPVAAPINRTHSSSFQHTNSSSTGSPTESILQQEYRRSRRISNTDAARPKPSSYMPAYIKDTHVSQHRTVEPHLAWPVVDYTKRKHLPEPLVYFDAGFNPRDTQFEVCTIGQRRRIPLTYEERNLVVATEKIVITNGTLNRWPIDMEPKPGSRRIRVIDVFRAIYDNYATPLSRDELSMIGPEYIQRCEPAFLQRCKDSNEPTHYLEYVGMRRIDLLKGRRIFKGLAYTGVVYDRGSHKHAFELHFDRGD